MMIEPTTYDPGVRPFVTCITVNTDASYHPVHKVGGYAFYLISDVFRIKHSGAFKKHPPNSEIAEVMAIGNALHALLKQNPLPTCDYLIVNSDCTYAMDAIKERRYESARIANNLMEELETKLKAKRVYFKHVKAHNGKPDARSHVNEWCDTEAKKRMREAVNGKTGGKS